MAFSPSTSPITAKEKAALIKTRLADLGASVGASDIQALYKEVVNPGFRAKAEHAIAVCTGTSAHGHIANCFDDQPLRRSLYALRNSINHGTIDVDDPEAAIVVAARFHQLWRLVFEMFSGVIRLHLDTLPVS